MHIWHSSTVIVRRFQTNNLCLYNAPKLLLHLIPNIYIAATWNKLTFKSMFHHVYIIGIEISPCRNLYLNLSWIVLKYWVYRFLPVWMDENLYQIEVILFMSYSNDSLPDILQALCRQDWNEYEFFVDYSEFDNDYQLLCWRAYQWLSFICIVNWFI